VLGPSSCPCGSTQRYDACCGRLHRGAAEAGTAGELMRARFAAYAVGETDFVWRTWHPRTRPTSVTHDDQVRWRRLEVLDEVTDGDRAEVEFRAHFDRAGAGPGVHHERSAFERRRGRWVYLETIEI
jgi:SEC-C motif domain protein